MNLEDKVSAERERVSAQLIELRNANAEDKELLEELKQSYLEAVTGTDATLIDTANEQIKAAADRIQRRKDQIDALSDNNNPNIQRIVSEAVEQQLNRFPAIEHRAIAIQQELAGHREAMLKGLAELSELHQKSVSIRDYVNSIGRQLNPYNQKKHGLVENGRTYGINIAQYINSLLIDQSHIRKL